MKGDSKIEKIEIVYYDKNDVKKSNTVVLSKNTTLKNILPYNTEYLQKMFNDRVSYFLIKLF